ncbi:M16 family metallopeptidase [Raineya orbicola]|uniref:Putative Zn-dependent peptidase n=1 Tax=Raineya orbicola TaxID=2016530 RepID=A0A2N3IF28_9BACT|nr:pitrilysin family protein [Raineya orbicola]PKQ68916.1 putative Zn-dependent peptidase [Raineya orbicola]
MENCQVFEFANGIRFVHKQVPYIRASYVGFVLDVGSRNETAKQAGLAHFWEHLAFKGTRRRSARQIINTLENVGGELNAYTTKEKICFYAASLDKHYEKAINLLTDITFNSIFPERQIEVERGVILEEIAMYKDSPDESLQDDFDAILFGSHPLGHNILGEPETVAHFHKQDFEEFFRSNADTSKIVLSSISNLPFNKALAIAEKYLKAIPTLKATHKRVHFKHYKPSQKTIYKPISQAHHAIGCTAYSLNDKKRVPFFMLNNILGGPSMNTRLNMALREKNGLVYGIEASYIPYTDTGEWGIYFATDLKNLAKAQTLIYKEIRKLKEQKLSHLQLHTAKQQLMGQIALAEENFMNLMLVLGKSLLDTRKIESLQEIFKKIEAISAEDIWEVANEIFDESQFSTLTYLPEGE